MKHKIIAALLAVLLAAALAVPAAALNEQEATADALNELGLFLGMGDGDYALDQKLTRAQGITLLVRMIGKEQQASGGSYATPFTDVPAWASGYVGYAYSKGITNGISANAFGSEQELSDAMFLTLVLRALGYRDSGEAPRFVWNSPYALAKQVGLTDKAEADASFTRADAVAVFWNALNAQVVGSGRTLAQTLIAQGVFTQEKFDKARQIQSGSSGDDGSFDTPTGTGARPIRPGSGSGSGSSDNSGSGQFPDSDAGVDLGEGGLPIIS